MPIAGAQGKESAATGYTSQALYASLHTADPGATGASEVAGGSPAYARKAVTWTAGGVDGVATATLAGPFDVPADTTITHIGLWTAASGGTYVDKAALSATFASQGTLEVASLTYTQS
jgi:hypothetical protein